MCVSGLRGVLAVPRRSDKLLKKPKSNQILLLWCSEGGAGVRQAPYALALCNINDTSLAEEKSKPERRSSAGISSPPCDTVENQDLLH